MATQELVGIGEIAEMAQRSKQAIVNWRQRYDSFPAPVQTLQSGPVWSKEVIKDWMNKFSNRPTHVLSFINLKGGVGKTTTAVAVAELLAQEDRKHVLVVDLDPQTNASVTLISEEHWAKLDKSGCTIAQLFADQINHNDSAKFNIEKAIVRGVSTINDGIARLDLLASSIQLIDIQDRIPMIALSGNFTVNPLEILKKSLDPIIDRYDYVIIDCPPSLGTVTKNGLRFSTGYVIPTIPDILSTWGIYQIIDNIGKFSQDVGRNIPALGIVATKVQANNLHRRVLADLAARRLGKFGEKNALAQPSLFKNSIPQAVATARGVDMDAGAKTFRMKYGSAYEPLRGLTTELRTICETKNL